MLKTLFTIESSEEKKGDVLLVEMGADYCCIAYGDASSKNIRTLKFYSAVNGDDVNGLTQMMADFRSDANLQKVVLCSAYPEALLVPQALIAADNGHHFLKDIYNVAGCSIKQDAGEIVTVYALPQGIVEAVTTAFPAAEFIHTYTTSLQTQNDFATEDQLSVHFTPKQFKVAVWKKERIQLMQTYQYTSPLDVVYYLLKIFEAFNLTQEGTGIPISGLIEKESALYKELHNYFLNIHFVQAPGNAVRQEEHPHHFFTSLYNLASCVL